MDCMLPLEAVWLVLPAYLANASAVVLGGGTPIDFGKTWRDKRLLGDGKTWRGAGSGILVGMAAGMLMNHLAPDTYGTGAGSLLIIFALAYGTLSGDMLESFVKRRLGKESGAHWPIADQVDFLIGAFTCSFLMSFFLDEWGINDGNWFLSRFTVWHVLFLLAFTPLLHYVTNVAGYLAGLKKVPW
ncbi:MAG: CDP-2,3-bis-(O-geranylgeranyl)-sn-glycerol synthase [Candidatus Thermoplasmatota archaeon]|nr:CDP-2,3-bis-(O-geranylgeranyl)-sn-glycerol synthase [Candidatus Thermoplasmatota archaeon]